MDDDDDDDDDDDNNNVTDEEETEEEGEINDGALGDARRERQSFEKEWHRGENRNRPDKTRMSSGFPGQRPVDFHLIWPLGTVSLYATFPS